MRMRLANVRNNSRLVSSVMRSVLGVPGAALLEELKGERIFTVLLFSSCIVCQNYVKYRRYDVFNTKRTM